jgi:hypothetical protein
MFTLFICFPFFPLGLDFVFMYFVILITSYCGVFVQSKNCGARETAVARQCPHTIEEVSRYVTRTAVAVERLGKHVRGDVTQQ